MIATQPRSMTIAFQGTHEEIFLNSDRLRKDIAMQSTVERQQRLLQAV